MTNSVVSKESNIITQMAFKVLLTPYTYRTAEQQEAILSKLPELADAPRYAPEDFPVLFRPSQRKTSDTLIAASTACFARTESAFVELLCNCRQKNICLEGLEEGFQWRPGQSTRNAVIAWKSARSKGSATIGAMQSAKNKLAASAKACELIEDRWGQPNQDWSTEILLIEAGKSIGSKKLAYNTAIKFLGKRPIAQYNYQAKLKRKAARDAKQ